MGAIDKFGIGADIENVERFKKPGVADNKQFLDKIFTKKELDYCFSKTKPEQHLAARYAGKEAIVKALCNIGKANIDYKKLEIINNEDDIPIVKLDNGRYNNLQIKISLSHCKDKAIALAIVMEV